MNKEVIDYKKAFRKGLSVLSIDKKVQIVANIQRVANQIRKKVGRPLMPQWKPRFK